ncbi:hypothetical protein D3C81_2172890 [compost metagenome]
MTSFVSKLPRNVSAWRVSTTRMDRINPVMKRTKLVRYNNGNSMPKGMKAAMFPIPTKSISVGCRRSERPGTLKKSSGKKIKVY